MDNKDSQNILLILRSKVLTLQSTLENIGKQTAKYYRCPLKLKSHEIKKVSLLRLIKNAISHFHGREKSEVED